MLNIFTRLGVALVAAALLFLALRPDQAHAIAAFPGAEGGGATSLGGRNLSTGRPIFVTNTNDSGTGSLRACVTAPGPRTCIFRTSGTINLASPLIINNSFLTIAGHTAPGGGIQLRGKTLAGHMILANGKNNIVIRYLRLRKGYNSSCSGSEGCGSTVRIVNSEKVVLDHNTIMWNQDEGVDFSNSHDITAQWNIVAEPVGSPTENHPTGWGFLGGASGVANSTNLDLHHNLTMTNNHRNPLMRNRSTRLVNNLWYNNRTYVNRAAGGVQVDVIGNRYKAGPLGGPRDKVISGLPAYTGSQFPGNPSFFLSGNIGIDQTTPPADQYSLAGSVNGLNGGENAPTTGTVPQSWRRTTALTTQTHPITPEAATGLEDSVLPLVGASRRLDCEGEWVLNRDTTDERLINEYKTNTGSDTLFVGGLGGGEVGYGGFPIIATGAQPCADTDLDGMPDQYEVIKGYSPSVYGPNADGDADGFTNLEEYLTGEAGVDLPPEGDKFTVGDRVFVNASTVNVRNEPTSTPGTDIGDQPQDAQGEVTDGPLVTSNGVIWWEINFDSGTDGWVGEGPLEIVVDADEPPAVAVTAPVNGAVVQGASVSVTASASDNTGVVGVQFKLDGANLGAEDTTSTYGVTWDTTAASNGPHTLTAVARDAAGNTTTSLSVAVTVNNVPTNGFILGTQDTFTSTGPPADSIRANRFTLTQRGTLQSMSVYAHTSGGNIRLGVYDDDGTAGDPGTLLAQSGAGSPGVAGWFTLSMTSPPTLDPGDYWLAFVTDGTPVLRGQSTGGTHRRDDCTFGAMCDPFVVATSNSWIYALYGTLIPAQDTTAPATAITAPSTGNVSGASVAVTASASDAVGVVGVSFHAVPPGGAPDATNIIGVEDTTSTYGVTWDTTTYVNGPYNVHSVARDAAGNKTISAAVAVTVANVLATPSGVAVVRDAE